MQSVFVCLAALCFLSGCSGPYSNPATATASTEKPLVVSVQTIAVESLPEVIVANHMGMKVLAISCVTNMAAGVLPQKINHEEVLETGARVRETLISLLSAILPRLETAQT